MSPQSKANIVALEKPSLSIAIKDYPRFWPPVYPAVLWGFSKIGLPMRLFNLFCFYGVLLALWMFTSKFLPRIPPLIPVLLVASNHSNYPNLYQQTSESLFLLLSWIILLAVAHYKKNSSILWVATVGMVTATASLTRFFGIVWLIPLAFILIAFFAQPEGSLKRKVTHIFVYFLPILLFVLPWILYLRSTTGSFTGMDRVSLRDFSAKSIDWNELTNFVPNCQLLFKTLFIDFFSPSRYATHKIVNLSAYTSLEMLTVSFVIGIVSLIVFLTLYKVSDYRLFAKAKEVFKTTSFLPVYFAITYVTAIIITWTYSNNDPIYTRFMFPSYSFIILSFLGLFSWIKARSTRVWELLPFYLLGMIYLFNNFLYYYTLPTIVLLECNLLV